MLTGSNADPSHASQKSKTLQDSLKKIVEIVNKPPKVWAKFNQKFEVLAQELARWGQKNKALKDKVRITLAEEDNALEQALKDATWNSPIFKETCQINALNLFEQGRITWQQKSTVSDIVETAHYFGDFIAYPILGSTGEFSREAIQYLTPLLRKKNFRLGKYSALELASFRKLIQALPLSEQFFFIYPQQKMDEKGSFPSEHNIIREEISNISTSTFPRTPGTHFMNLTYEEDSEGEIENITYDGILKLSYGAGNALGLVTYGQKDWFALIPCIDRQTINDVDRLGQARARPTLTAESRLMGMITEQEITHSVLIPFPDVVAHDSFHREVSAFLGNDVYSGVERIIQLARATFGVQWSKDIWLLRDFNLLNQYLSAFLLKEISRSSAKNDAKESTMRFAYVLLAEYFDAQLENCTEDTKARLEEKPIMFDENFYPRQIALCFIIDLVTNEQAWLKHNISNDESYYQGPYPRLIKMAKFLNKNGIFKDDMKGNVLKFDAFIKTQGDPVKDVMLDLISGPQFKMHWGSPPDWELQHIIAQLNEIKETDFETIRDNKQVFLGFKKKVPLQVLCKLSNDSKERSARMLNVKRPQ